MSVSGVSSPGNNLISNSSAASTSTQRANQADPKLKDDNSSPEGEGILVSPETSTVTSNVNVPGPTGTVGDIKKNPVANPNISQVDTTSTQHISRQTTDVGDTRTKASDNKKEDLSTAAENVSPVDVETNRAITRAVLSHGNSTQIGSMTDVSSPSNLFVNK